MYGPPQTRILSYERGTPVLSYERGESLHVQGYLAHKKRPPPYDPHGTLGIGLQ